MYGVTFSLCRWLWLTGTVGPQAVAGRHSSTRPLAGGRLGAGIINEITNYHHTGPDCTSNGELKNLVINYHLQSYVMARSMVFFLKFRRVLKK